MKIIFSLVLLVQSLMSCAQEGSDRDNIKRINSYVKDNIAISSSTYAIYSLRDKYLVITKSNDSLIVNYLSESSGFVGTSKYKGNVLQTLFSDKFLGSPFNVYMGDDFKGSCIESLVYLSIYDANQLVSEFLLPSVLLCDQKKVEYPIPDVLLRELFNLVDSKWSSE